MPSLGEFCAHPVYSLREAPEGSPIILHLVVINETVGISRSYEKELEKKEQNKDQTFGNVPI